MKLIFYGNRKSLIAIMICAVLLSGSHVAHATNEPEPTYSSQQTGKIKGTVTDTNGETVIGASIVLKGTTNGTITDMDGNFTLSDVPANGTIQVSFIGYKTLEVQVKGQTSFNLTLSEDAETLDEVVVVGYGTMKKSDLTGAVGSISSENLPPEVPPAWKMHCREQFRESTLPSPTAVPAVDLIYRYVVKLPSTNRLPLFMSLMVLYAHLWIS